MELIGKIIIAAILAAALYAGMNPDQTIWNDAGKAAGVMVDRLECMNIQQR